MYSWCFCFYCWYLTTIFNFRVKVLIDNSSWMQKLNWTAIKFLFKKFNKLNSFIFIIFLSDVPSHSWRKNILFFMHKISFYITFFTITWIQDVKNFNFSISHRNKFVNPLCFLSYQGKHKLSKNKNFFIMIFLCKTIKKLILSLRLSLQKLNIYSHNIIW